MLRPITFSRRVFLCWRWICSPGCHFDYLAEKKPPKYVVFNRNLYILYPTRPVTLEPGQNFRSNWMDIFHFSKKNNWTLEDQHGLFRPQKTIGNIKTERIHLHNHHKVPAMHPDQKTVLARSKFCEARFLVGVGLLIGDFPAESDSKTYYTPVIQVEIRNSDHLAIQYYVDVYPPKKLFHSTFLLTPQRASRSFHQDRKLQPFDAAT